MHPNHEPTPGHDLATIIRTLVLDGFHLDSFRRSYGHVVLNMHRYDRFGILIPYAIALFDDAASETALSALLPAAEYERRLFLLVAPSAPDRFHSVTLDGFLSLLGGAVDDSIVRHPRLADILDALGRHNLPDGFDGNPEEHLEAAVAGCLQFLLGQRVRRWGVERRFEPLPDGVLPSAPILLYDAKSYTDPYAVSADDIRRFTDYVTDFNRRYGPLIGDVFSFLVVAGEFAHDEEQRERRSAELYAGCRTTLCHISGRTLGTIVGILRSQPQIRPALDWRRLLARHTLTQDLFEAEVLRLKRDALLPRD